MTGAGGQIKEEAARRRAIKEARRKQSNISASLQPSRGRAQSDEAGLDALSPVSATRTGSDGSMSGAAGGGERALRLSVGTDDCGGGRLSDGMLGQDWGAVGMEYAEELQERDEMLAERDAEVGSLKGLVLTLQGRLDEVMEASAAHEEALRVSERSLAEVVRLLQTHYRLLAEQTGEMTRLRLQQTQTQTQSSVPSPDKSSAPVAAHVSAAPRSPGGSGGIAAEKDRSLVSVLCLEKEEAVQEARRLRFRLEDQEVVWKVRLEGAQEDVSAYKNKLLGKELALEILLKERDDALAEVASLKQAIAGMFDSMSDPCSPSSPQAPSIVDELRGPVSKASPPEKDGQGEDDSQWASRMEEMQRQLDYATRRRSLNEQEVDSILEDLDRDKHITLDQKVAQRRMSQQLESVEAKSEQVTHTVGSTFRSPPVKQSQDGLLTSVSSAWNASSNKSEVSSDCPDTPEVASVSNSSTTTSQRSNRLQRRLSVEESHAALTDLETKLSRISRRPSLMADTAGVNIEAQSLVYEAMVMDFIEEDEIVKYRVVVRALGNIEWTLYRRYSEFRELYNSISVMTNVEFGECVA